MSAKFERPYEKEPHGHAWERDEDGKLDIFAYAFGEYCNGPRCTKCGYGFCHHCQALPDEECSVPNGDAAHD